MEFNRLTFSRHTRDLLIIVLTLYIFSFALYEGTVQVFDVSIVNLEQDNQKILFSVLSGIVGIDAYVTAWAYRTASARLTAIDVLVSDMYSVCRGIAAMGSVNQLIEGFRRSEKPFLVDVPEGGRFVTPISDLGFLSTNSIHRVIGFYVSLQMLNAQIAAFRDADKSGEAAEDGKSPEARRAQACSLIYAYFIACENARIAMHRLLGISSNSAFYVSCVSVCFATDIRCLAFLISEPGAAASVSAALDARLRSRLATDPSPLRDPEESYRFPPYGLALDVYLDETVRSGEIAYVDQLRRLFGGLVTHG
jgi:hypothetical protein